MTSTTHQPCTAMPDTVSVLESTPDSYSSGVDYITAFWSEADRHRFPEAHFIKQINGRLKEGEKRHASCSNGIDWWGSTHARIGVRDDERFYRASEHGAEDGFEKAAGTCSSLSRIDLAVTLEYPRGAAGVAQRLYTGFGRLPRAFGQPRSARLVDDTSGGSTCYVGSRTSDVYLRVYDWGVAHETGAAGTYWRFEAELKGSVATRHAALLMSETQRELAAAGMVRALFSDRRIMCPWNEAPLRPMARPKLKPELEQRLDWLRQQVSPTCTDLISQGYIEAVIDALGLTQHVSMKPPRRG